MSNPYLRDIHCWYFTIFFAVTNIYFVFQQNAVTVTFLSLTTIVKKTFFFLINFTIIPWYSNCNKLRKDLQQNRVYSMSIQHLDWVYNMTSSIKLSSTFEIKVVTFYMSSLVLIMLLLKVVFKNLVYLNFKTQRSVNEHGLLSWSW